MNILLVHQNMPGQYRELLDWLIAQGEHRIVFLTQRRDYPERPGVTKVVYPAHHRPKRDAYGLSKVWEEAAGLGYGAAEAAQKLRNSGFSPDVILGHTGWGELLFMKKIWPDVPILGFFEYFYNDTGGIIGFDPEDPPSAQSPFLLQARNVVPFANLHVIDQGIAPTQWQKDLFPPLFQSKLACCHDGIRTERLTPDPLAEVTLNRLKRPLTRDDEVITYMARNMERTRGFHIMMRALPEILKARPDARVILIGGSGTSYGSASDAEGGLRAEMEAEVGHLIDWDRVHFVGQVPYEDFQKIIQISRCHIYLTMPFVLSWSMLECMSMGATIVSSDVAPVREAITHAKTGFLVDFFDSAALARQVSEVSANPDKYAHIGAAARAHAVKTYDFLNVCLPEHLRMINALVPADKAIPLPDQI